MAVKQKSPAQALRGALAAQICARGERSNNIWVVRPPYDHDALILASDGAMELFYYIEGEAKFQEISYALLRAKSPLCKPYQPLPFAEVKTLEGQAKTVFLKRSNVAGTEVDDAIVIDLSRLSAHEMRTQNWRRIVPCIRRIRLHSVVTIERQVMNALGDGMQRSLRQVLAELGMTAVPLALGAIAGLLRRRVLVSDCDTQPWSRNTLVGIRGS